MDFQVITCDEDLRKVMVSLAQEKELAFDVEMEANFHHYGVHLSLIQISTHNRTWVVDCLAVADLTPVKVLLVNASVLKVFHDVSFDFRVLLELLGVVPQNIFDTKVAALLLGRDVVSLAGLLQEEFGVKKETKWQRADWLRRPLPQEMLNYAAHDTMALLRLKDRLVQELISKDRLRWFEEQMRSVQQADYSSPEHSCNDIKGSGGLTPVQRGRLHELYVFRDQVACELDKPHFFVIPDKKLLELSREPPRTLEELSKVKGIHPVVKKRWKELFTALSKSRPLSKPARIPKSHLHDVQLKRVDDLLVRARKVAESLGLETPVVLTREQAERVVLSGSSSCLFEWQREVLSVDEVARTIVG